MDRITDRPDMTSAVYRGRKASTQTDKTKNYKFFYKIAKNTKNSAERWKSHDLNPVYCMSLQDNVRKWKMV